MSKLLLPLLCLCMAVWLFGGSVWFGNQYQQENTAVNWALKDGVQSFTSSTLFSFQKSDPEVFLDDHQDTMLMKIAQYLDRTPDRHLELTGYYTKDEINNSDYENIGQARAENFRNLISRKGVDLDQLHAFSKLIKSHELNSNGLINGGVDFSFVESPLTKYGSAFSLSKLIYFKEKSTTELANEDFDPYIAALRQYLTDHPNKKLNLIGFNRTSDTNELTQKRVLNLKKNLLDLGIPEKKLRSNLETFNDRNNADSYVKINIF